MIICNFKTRVIMKNKDNKPKLDISLLDNSTTPFGTGDGLYHMGGNYFAVSPIKKKKDFQVKFSQVSVSPETGTKIVTKLDDLADKMRTKGWKDIPPVQAAFINGDLVVHDHRRVMAAIAAEIRIFMCIKKGNARNILQRIKENKLDEPLASLPDFNGSKIPFTGKNLEAYLAASRLFSGISSERNVLSDMFDSALNSPKVQKKTRSRRKPPKETGVLAKFCLNDTDQDLKTAILRNMR